MDIKKLAGINTKINNVSRIYLPYLWSLSSKESDSAGVFRKRMVIFFGSDMNGILKPGFADKDLYIAQCNECLDYIRRNFEGYDLYYKPHPADEKECLFLNLKGFNLILDKTTAELFLWQNLPKIKCVFAVNSWSAVSARSFGLDVYLFNRLFKNVYSSKYYESVETYLAQVPDTIFVNDLKQKLTENKIYIAKDECLGHEIRELFSSFHGKIWLVFSHTEFAVSALSLARFLKNILHGVKINLVVSRHPRWDFIKQNDISDCFDEIKFFPRIFYSLEPRKLFNNLKIALAVKKFGIKPDDMIISFSQVEFLENCFLSYYKRNKRIGFIGERDFNFNYNPENQIFSGNDNFRFTKASWFYNKIWEPFLGLNKTAFQIYDDGELFVLRYQKPINDIFNKVFICTTQ
ncbi:MAG: hypothetical protein HYT61_01255 [Candidatus Yanofskybacteria bacterium]|nr:hypothetical protein [Candidatus Yanofskybacteria bacterium]